MWVLCHVAPCGQPPGPINGLASLGHASIGMIRSPRARAPAEQRLVLTSPMNQTEVLGRTHARVPPAPRQPAPLEELEAQVAELRHELRFSSAVPISHWIRCADALKRQADQHHNASDLEMQYLCLAKCDVLLSQLMPREHTGWYKLDRETRAECKRHAALIHDLVWQTRDALLDARGDATPATQPPFSPSSQAATPTRSSFRQVSRASKHVSFADAPPSAKNATESSSRAWPDAWPSPRLPPSPPPSLAGQPPLGPPPLGCLPLSPPPTSPVAQPPCIPPSRPRRLRRRPSERLFLTADPLVTLPVARGVPRHGL